MIPKKENTNKRAPHETEAIERSLRLIHAILDGRTPVDLKDRMLEWFESDMSWDAKFDALEEVMHATLQPDEKPSPRVYQKLRELKQKLKEEEARKLNADRHRFSPVWFRVAAVVLPFFVVFGVGYLFVTRDLPEDGGEHLLNHLQVEVLPGVQKDILLSDNSVVWLNSGSRVVYPDAFNDERCVELAGKAYFKVERDEQKPFVVHTEHLQVRVLGTEFEVVAYPDSEKTDVLLHSGAVEVCIGEETVQLAPGEKLTYSHETKRWEVAGVAVLADWRSDRIMAIDQPLAQIFRMIENYYDIRVVFAEEMFDGQKLYEVTFGKRITPEEVMDALAAVSGAFRYKINDDEIIVERLQ